MGVKKLIFILLLLLTCNLANAAQIKLAWDANAETDLVIGYKVYYGMESGVYLSQIDVGSVTTFILDGLLPGTYFVAVTAYNTDGESGFSNEVNAMAVSMAEVVSAPTILLGPVSGTTGVSYDFTGGGSTSNYGHDLQYQFDWKGDGSMLSAWGSTVQSKSWGSAGTYNIKVRVRCATDTGVVSTWFGPLSITISKRHKRWMGFLNFFRRRNVIETEER